MGKGKPLVFYNSDRYQKAREIIMERASGLCLDQIALPSGGVMEKWNVGGRVVLLVCEHVRHGGSSDAWYVEIYAPVSVSNLWKDTEKALDLMAEKPRLDIRLFAKLYKSARESGDYTELDELVATSE